MLAPAPAASVSLDDAANDGLPGEGDNYASDIEDVSILGQGVVVPSGSTLIGSAGPNELVTGPGNDTINAGAGLDRVTADAGDDTIAVRDGFSDRVRCGAGTDTVVADTLDLIGADCETVNVADAGNALDDRPPTIAWAFPKANARLKADPSNPLTVTAADDRGIAMVRFLDDDEVICEITAPPYTCGYRANLGDVGRNTLSAVAVDTAGQTTTIQRAVTVNRFRPPLKITIERGFRITGRLESAGAGCRGTVTVRAVRRQAHRSRRASSSSAPAAPTRRRSSSRAAPACASARTSAATRSSWRELCQKQRLGERDLLSSSRSTDSFAAWICAASESCAPHSTISASGIDLGEAGDERDRAAAAHDRDRLAVGGFRAPGPRTRRRRARADTKRARPRSRAARPTACARAGGARRRPSRRRGSAPGGTRTATLARAAGMTMFPAPSTAGASRPRTEIAWRAHRRSATLPAPTS